MSELKLHQFEMNVDVFGPIRISQELQRRPRPVLKSHRSGQDFFTDITLFDRQGTSASGMRVRYKITASFPEAANRAGAVYVGQLCDLLSVVTRSPVWFSLSNENNRNRRIPSNPSSSSVSRILTEDEWSWISDNLVPLRQNHPRFLAASSWYRKGLIGRDCLDDFCCYWRVIERLAYSYADKSGWKDEEKKNSRARRYIEQLTDDLFSGAAGIPDALSDTKTVSAIIKLRNDLTHGNQPITLEVIENATAYLKPLEHAAFLVLQGVKSKKVNFCDRGGHYDHPQA